MSINYVRRHIRKAHKKLHALAKIAKYMKIIKPKMLMKLLSLQFSYCPLTRMFQIRKIEHSLNDIPQWSTEISLWEFPWSYFLRIAG